MGNPEEVPFIALEQTHHQLLQRFFQKTGSLRQRGQLTVFDNRRWRLIVPGDPELFSAPVIEHLLQITPGTTSLATIKADFDFICTEILQRVAAESPFSAPVRFFGVPAFSPPQPIPTHWTLITDAYPETQLTEAFLRAPTLAIPWPWLAWQVCLAVANFHVLARRPHGNVDISLVCTSMAHVKRGGEPPFAREWFAADPMVQMPRLRARFPEEDRRLNIPPFRYTDDELLVVLRWPRMLHSMTDWGAYQDDWIDVLRVLHVLATREVDDMPHAPVDMQPGTGRLSRDELTMMTRCASSFEDLIMRMLRDFSAPPDGAPADVVAAASYNAQRLLALAIDTHPFMRTAMNPEVARITVYAYGNAVLTPSGRLEKDTLARHLVDVAPDVVRQLQNENDVAEEQMVPGVIDVISKALFKDVGFPMDVTPTRGNGNPLARYLGITDSPETVKLPRDIRVLVWPRTQAVVPAEIRTGALATPDNRSLYTLLDKHDFDAAVVPMAFTGDQIRPGRPPFFRLGDAVAMQAFMRHLSTIGRTTWERSLAPH